MKRKTGLFGMMIIILALLCGQIFIWPTGAAAAEATGGDGTYLWPVSADIDIAVGWNYEDGSYHGAADFELAIGGAVHAVAAGTVTRVLDGCRGSHLEGAADACSLGDNCPIYRRGGTTAHDGNIIVIDHGNGVTTRYCHLRAGGITVRPGDTVTQGQTIAASGASGEVLKPHLHFELNINGNPADPAAYLTRRTSPIANHNPVILLEAAEAPVNGTLKVRGWAYDPDNLSAPLETAIYIIQSDGSEILAGSLTANQARTDLSDLYQRGTHYHGFEGNLAISVGGSFSVQAEARNIGEGEHIRSDLIRVTTGRDLTPPVLSDIAVTNVSERGYTVSVTATDNAGVASVTMPSWTGAYSSDVEWPEASRSGDRYSHTVRRNGESGVWQTEIHASDISGNQAPLISVVLRRVTLTFNPAGGVCDTANKMIFHISYLVNYANRAYLVKYGELPTPRREGYSFDGWRTAGGAPVTSDTVLTATTNQTLYAHWVQTESTPPAITDVKLTDLSLNGYTISVTATDNIGVTNVRMPSWTGAYSPDTAWPDAERVENSDEWTCNIKRSGEPGVWHTEIYAYDAAGNQAPLVSVYLRHMTAAFDPNGGTCDIADKTVFHAFYLYNYQNQTYLTRYGELPTPVRTGYQFNGWYTEKTGGERVTSETVVRTDLDHTLYAHWSASRNSPTPTRTPTNTPTPRPDTPTSTPTTRPGAPTSTPTRTPTTRPGVPTRTPTRTPTTRPGAPTSTPTRTPTTRPDTPTPTSSSVADRVPMITVGSVSTRAGGDVRVPISIRNNPGVASVLLRVEYNQKVLKLKSVEDGGILGQSETAGNQNLTAMPLILSWSNDTASQNRTGNGVIATLIFSAADTASGSYPIRVSYNNNQHDIFNIDMKPVQFTISNGSVRIVDTEIGDVNADGAVTALDRVWLARYLAGWPGYTSAELDLTAADVNADGAVTALDRIILARHIAGWSGYETLPYNITARAASQNGAVLQDFQENAVLQDNQENQENQPAILIENNLNYLNNKNEIICKISVQNAPALSALDFDLSWPEEPRLVRVQDCNLFSEKFYNSNNLNPARNHFHFSWGNDLNPNPAPIDGEILTLTFKTENGANHAKNNPDFIKNLIESIEIQNPSACDVNLNPVIFTTRTVTPEIKQESEQENKSEITRDFIELNIIKNGVRVSSQTQNPGAWIYLAAYDENGVLRDFHPRRMPETGEAEFDYIPGKLNKNDINYIKAFLFNTDYRLLASARIDL